jgi:ribosomal protein S18 acetylase RimI-like enzyme
MFLTTLGVIMNCMSIFSMDPPMRSTETLRQLENCYEALYPPQENTDETFLWFSGISHPLFNAVMHFRPEGDLEKKIDHLLQKVPSHCAYSFWVESGPQARQLIPYLENRGFSPILTCPLMRWVVKMTPPAQFDIRRTNDEIFHQIVATVNELDEITQHEYARLLDQDCCENYVIFADEKPVGTGTLVVRGYLGGIFNIATLPEYQRKGYGRIITQHLMRRAYELRMQHVVLLSSPLAEKLYADLGFEKTEDVTLYVSPLKN